MEIGLVALAGLPAVSTLVLDVAALIRRPAPVLGGNPDAHPTFEDELPGSDEVVPIDADEVEESMAALMWVRSQGRSS